MIRKDFKTEGKQSDRKVIKSDILLQGGPLDRRSQQMEDLFEILLYLHECDEQEEGVGSPSDLFIQEAGQEGEHSIFGSTIKRKKQNNFNYLCSDGGIMTQC